VAEFSVASAPALSSKEEDDDKKEDDQIVRPNKEYNICTDTVNTLLFQLITKTAYQKWPNCGPPNIFCGR